MTLKTLAAAACITLAVGSSACAATFNFVGGFSGGQLGDVSFDITIDADFSADIAETSDGLTVNSLTSSVVGGNPFPLAGGPGYRFIFDKGRLIFGGFSRTIDDAGGRYNDFSVRIDQFQGRNTGQDPRIGVNIETAASQKHFGSATSAEVAVTEVSPVPLPAGGLLLLSAFGGVAALKRRTKRAA